ncbi:hypothetical protein NAG84_09865 [Proteus terrae]|uniref:hypothetical protein n=1 Tax=Proteus TaxID=583 RepID=UPI0013A588EA|nr:MULTISPECIES: hypothetical protein [Proteus]MCO7050149.1 hypothetical protein [Proteus terrae]MCS6714613.1 hypothetical protein [Proteus terrae]MCS6733494.1 hypothetical protein [Proteus terrae]MCT8230110.1 hypothetical protein [Proteus terrae]
MFLILMVFYQIIDEYTQPNGDATTEGQSVILKENSKMMVGFWLTNSAPDDTFMKTDCLNEA